MPIAELTAQEAKRRLDQGEIALVDVREVWELELAHIDGALHIPLGELPERLHELPADRALVFVCHHGVRSLHACLVARAGGLVGANLRGGIAAWSAEVDPKVPQY
ncbi:MAG: rhodanese [Deltaproteobacteria bacterium]|nr:rhodanese [Deltaproteobacteria bacterium]